MAEQGATVAVEIKSYFHLLISVARTKVKHLANYKLLKLITTEK